jgi:hypothetical protein
MKGKRAFVVTAGVALAFALAPRAGAQGNDDRGVAEALVKQLEQDTARQAVLSEALKNANDALERARRMHAAGDEDHARAAEGLAREWAETGRDLARAAQAEANAADLRQKALDAQAKLERERALIEEGIARVGRLNAELTHAQEPSRQAVEVHDDGTSPALPERGRKPAEAPREPKKDATKKSAASPKGPAVNATKGDEKKPAKEATP